MEVTEKQDQYFNSEKSEKPDQDFNITAESNQSHAAQDDCADTANNPPASHGAGDAELADQAGHATSLEQQHATPLELEDEEDDEEAEELHSEDESVESLPSLDSETSTGSSLHDLQDLPEFASLEGKDSGAAVTTFDEMPNYIADEENTVDKKYGDLQETQTPREMTLSERIERDAQDDFDDDLSTAQLETVAEHLAELRDAIAGGMEPPERLRAQYQQVNVALLESGALTSLWFLVGAYPYQGVPSKWSRRLFVNHRAIRDHFGQKLKMTKQGPDRAIYVQQGRMFLTHDGNLVRLGQTGSILVWKRLKPALEKENENERQTSSY